MPRPPRIVVPDIPHHVVQRGNQSRTIFLDPNDHLIYLSILKRQCNRAGVSVQGYCLMQNHVHLIVTPDRENSLSSAIGQAHHLYSQNMNRHRDVTGHLWEHHFYSCPLDENHFIRALLYVDRNPVRAGLVMRTLDWPWSSAVAHAGGVDQADLVDRVEWQEWSEKMGWDELSQQEEDALSIDALRYHTRTGRPLGDDTFLGAIENRLGFPISRFKPGRPPNRNKVV